MRITGSAPAPPKTTRVACSNRRRRVDGVEGGPGTAPDRPSTTDPRLNPPRRPRAGRITSKWPQKSIKKPPTAVILGNDLAQPTQTANGPRHAPPQVDKEWETHIISLNQNIKDAVAAHKRHRKFVDVMEGRGVAPVSVLADEPPVLVAGEEDVVQVDVAGDVVAEEARYAEQEL